MSIDKLTPTAVVAELDRYIIGQKDAKRAVAVALRNRWRRQQLDSEPRDEVTPKNILMIGPTGCGKTEISRRHRHSPRLHSSHLCASCMASSACKKKKYTTQ